MTAKVRQQMHTKENKHSYKRDKKIRLRPNVEGKKRKQDTSHDDLPSLLFAILAHKPLFSGLTPLMLHVLFIGIHVILKTRAFWRAASAIAMCSGRMFEVYSS